MHVWKHRLALAGLLLFGEWVAVSPVSPLALWLADAAVVRGEPDLGVARYDAVSRWSPLAEVRRRALARAASTYAVELGDPATARERLERMLELGVPDLERAALYGRMAELFVEERRVGDGAAAWERAYEAAPSAPEAALALTRSAELFAEHGDVAHARTLWMRLSERFPEHAARGAIGRAELSLRDGDAVEALSLFEEAEAVATTEPLRAHARLGTVTCLERLGNLDEALAGIDLADLPGNVRDRRREGLINRRAYR